MRGVQRFTYPALLLTLIVLCLFLTAPIQAQDEASQPAPQFLYRDDTRLILVDGYTGETTELPFEVGMMDRFVWSPDGRYLMTRLYDDESRHYCLNLYDVDELEWLYDEPISCSAGEAIFTPDVSHIVYASTDHINSTLWLYALTDQTSQELYRTSEGNEISPNGISGLKWSPTEAYLTFVYFRYIMGGSINTLIVMNMDSQDYVEIYAPDSYYASYTPIWSADDRWFLIRLQNQYVTSGALPFTNHEGDVYLVNSDTGENFRLTYTPAEYEYDIHWTDDGAIAFMTTEIIVHDFNFTLDQAMNVPEIPAEDIVLPEPVEADEYRHDTFDNVLTSPDPNIGAWDEPARTPEEDYVRVLNIGNLLALAPEAEFSLPLSESYTLIGWRPSDYPYARG